MVLCEGRWRVYGGLSFDFNVLMDTELACRLWRYVLGLLGGAPGVRACAETLVGGQEGQGTRAGRGRAPARRMPVAQHQMVVPVCFESRQVLEVLLK